MSNKPSMNLIWNPLQINLLFDQNDYSKIVTGYDYMGDMNQKWRIVLKDSWLTFDRTWTKDQLYKLRLKRVGENYITSESFTSNSLELEDPEITFQEINNFHLLAIGELLERNIFGKRNIASSILGNMNFKSKSKLNLNSIHGINHWRKVEKIGRYLAGQNGADLDIVIAFAYMHDWARLNDDNDPEHGARAIKMLDGLTYRLELSESQLEKLTYAIEHHSNRFAQSDDITIQTCWDSDRLDMWRVGFTPDPKLLYTEQAKQDSTLQYSKSLNLYF